MAEKDKTDCPGNVLIVKLTSEGSVSTCLQIHFAVAPLAHLSGVVADVVATIFSAAQADSFLEAVGAGALECKAHMVPVHQGVHEQVHGTFVLAFHCLHEIWGRRTQVEDTAYSHTEKKQLCMMLINLRKGTYFQLLQAFHPVHSQAARHHH